MSATKPPLGAASAYVGYRKLDLLGEIIAVGEYESVSKHAIALDLGGFECRVIGLDDLITCKRALGRPKDLRVVQELELVRQHLSDR